MAEVLNEVRPNLDRVAKPILARVKEMADKVDALNATIASLQTDKDAGTRPTGFTSIRIPKIKGAGQAELEEKLKNVNARALQELLEASIIARTGERDSMRDTRENVISTLKATITTSCQFVVDKATLQVSAVQLAAAYNLEVDEKLAAKERKANLHDAFTDYRKVTEDAKNQLDEAQRPPETELSATEKEVAKLKKDVTEMRKVLKSLDKKKGKPDKQEVPKQKPQNNQKGKGQGNTKTKDPKKAGNSSENDNKPKNPNGNNQNKGNQKGKKGNKSKSKSQKNQGKAQGA